jgi:hypothetical protein
MDIGAANEDNQMKAPGGLDEIIHSSGCVSDDIWKDGSLYWKWKSVMIGIANCRSLSGFTGTRIRRSAKSVVIKNW